MATTLVGVFDNRNQAQQACDRLMQQGIDRNMIEMTWAEKEASTSTSASSGSGDHRGFFARLFGLDSPDEMSGHYAEAVRRGSCVVTVNLRDDAQADRVEQTLEQAGAIDVDHRLAQWKAQGYKGYDASAAPYSREQADRERETFQVLEEDIKLGKRQVEGGGIRVHRRVTEKPVNEQISLREEHAVVNRHAVNRPATEADLRSLDAKDRDIEIREMREEPVVSKTARVVEEVDIGKRATERTETVKDTVRRSDVDIEQLGADQRPLPGGKAPPSRTQPPPR